MGLFDYSKECQILKNQDLVKYLINIVFVVQGYVLLAVFIKNCCQIES